MLTIVLGGCLTQQGNEEGSRNGGSSVQNDTTQHNYGAYYYAKKSIFEILPNDTNEIIFVGNSITDFCDWYELFGKANIKNRGIGGDIIEGVIYRLDEITESHPAKIFLMIGTNDLDKDYCVNEILKNYEVLVELILTKTPETKLYLQSVLPTKDDPKRKNTDIMEINNGIVEIAKKRSLTYVNLFDLFKTDKNEMNMDFSFDGLHLNGKGYLIWKDAVVDYIED